MKAFFIISGLCALSALPLAAQDMPSKKSTFSIYAGPSWYLGKFIGITNTSDTYKKGLRDGVSWNANYNYVTSVSVFNTFKLSPGLIYQGSRYSNSHDEGADKILMHYIAPQIGLVMAKRSYNLSFFAGVGWQVYTDKSTVFDKPRKVSMNKLAYNLSLSGEYIFSKHVGIIAKVNWIGSSSENYSVKYHGEKWQVDMPDLSGGGGFFSQLSPSIGLNLHF